MRTLIVEDDPSVASLLIQYLMPIVGIEPVIVGDMRSAEAALATVDPYDIITLDLNLPDSRGPQTLQKIRRFKELHPNALLIVVTGILAREDEKQVFESGGDGLMIKTESMRTERNFLTTMANILRSIARVPERFTKNVQLLESVTNRIATHFTEDGKS